MASVIYVDAVNGSDLNNGLSEGAAVKSFATAASLLTDGAQLKLHAGQTWSETLWLRTPNVTVSAYGVGADPLIDGGSARHGIVVQASGATINSINVSHAWNGIYVTGANTSVTIHGGVYDANGTGIVAGGGGVLTLVDGSICKNSTLSLGAGDGIQVSEDASAGLHTFVNVQCYGNVKQGLNFKIGSANVSSSTFEHNGETGVLGQVNASYMTLTNNNISHNNTVNNGTFNLGMENFVEIHSSGNIYADPTPGSLAYNNINMSGATKFYSTGDTFIESSSMTHEFGSSIRVNTATNASFVQVTSPVLQVAHSWGWFIDAWGATSSHVSAFNADFSVLPDTVYRAPDGSTPALVVGTSTDPAPAVVDLTLNGTASADTLTGGAGKDTFDGKGGADKLYGMDGDDLLIGGAGADALDGGAGQDTVSYSTATFGVTANLSSPSLNKGDAAGDTYFSIENLSGSAYADVLRGDGGANVISGGAGNDTFYGNGGADVLQGGDGADVLFGGAGADILYGGAGADRFVFQTTSDSSVAGPDTIGDFAVGLDRIDLRDIDANANIPKNQAFTYVGGADFSGKAGELHLVNGVVSGDVNGDKIADFAIHVTGVTSLSSSDFYL